MQHSLHIYQKPAIGELFLERRPVANYRHSITAIGGFDTASCDITIRSREEGQKFLDQYIGNRVAVFVDNPFEPIWEGFINRMTFDAGGVQYTISLDEMANYVTVQYSLAGSTSPALTAAADDTDSIAIFGRKQETVELGPQRSLNTTTFNALRDSILVQRAWPKASFTRGNGNGLLHLEMLGFYHTLMWETFRNASTGNVTVNNMIDTVAIPSLGNGTIFFDNADFTEVGANALTVDQEKLRSMTFWELLLEMQEYGDSSNPFVVGITPTIASTGTRRLYYRAFNTTIEYTAQLRDGLRIRNVYGRLLPPWTVRPDRGIRISDALIGWNGVGDNPTESYIQSIDYDANQQTVDWQGADDTTTEGAFNFRRHGKAIGKRFGAVRRVA